MLIFQENKTDCVVNCDWLAFSVVTTENPIAVCEGEEVPPRWNAPNGYRLEEHKGTNLFKYRVILLSLEGEKLLTMQLAPKSPKISHAIGLVQISNGVLYGSKLAEVCGLANVLFPCRFYKVSRIDICCDFAPTEEQMEIICKLSDGRAYVANKKAGSMFFEQKDRNRVPHCISFGSKTSEIKWKLYNKTKELREVEDKPYIRAQWLQMGWKDKEVWRLEVSMSSASQLLWDGRLITLEDVESGQWLYKVFVFRYNHSFIVRENQGHTRGVNDRKLDLLSLDKVDGKMRWKESEGLQPSKESIIQFNKAYNQLSSDGAQCDLSLFDMWANMATSIADKYGLHMYFLKVYGKTIEESIATLRESAGEGKFETQERKEEKRPAAGLKAIKTPLLRSAKDYEDKYHQDVEELRNFWNTNNPTNTI